MAFFGRAADLAEAEGDLDTRVAAVLGLARGQVYNLTPGLLPVRLHAAYDATTSRRPRARLAAALARCWAYANEPVRARPFAIEALDLADGLDDPVLLADALDAALASHWGPDELARRRDWAVRLDDAAAHLRDPDARLQAQLWGLTVAWEVLDLHGCTGACGPSSCSARSPRGPVLRVSRTAAAGAAAPELRRRPGAGPAGRGRRPGRGDPGRRGSAARDARLPGLWSATGRARTLEGAGYETYAVEHGADRRARRGGGHVAGRRPAGQGRGDGRRLPGPDAGRAAPRQRLAADPAVRARRCLAVGRPRGGRRRSWPSSRRTPAGRWSTPAR